jgi:hypothetical protein
MQWKSDRILLGEFVFQLQLSKTDEWDLGDECFAFYKTRELVAQYKRFWAMRDQAQLCNIVELGLWDGGSSALWYEWLAPEKLVGLDRSTRGGSEYFRRYVEKRGAADQLKTYWGIDQATSAR